MTRRLIAWMRRKDHSAAADPRISEDDLPQVERLESRLCLGGTQASIWAGSLIDRDSPRLTSDVVPAVQSIDSMGRGLSQPSARAAAGYDRGIQEAEEVHPPVERATGGAQTPGRAPVLSPGGLDSPITASVLPGTLGRTPFLSVDAGIESQEPVGSLTQVVQPPPASFEADAIQSSVGSVQPSTPPPDASDAPAGSSSSKLTAESLRTLGLTLTEGGATGVADSATAAQSGYTAWWTAADEPVVISYDFRDLDAFENTITDEQQALAEQALDRWSAATGGQVLFQRDTEAPIHQIINIGNGDLAAFGRLSEEGNVLGLGGGRVAFQDDGTFTVSGTAWLDQAEQWDTGTGNDDGSGTVDFATVVAHEIGHTLGMDDTQGRNVLSMMDGRYAGERDASTIDYAVRHGSFYRTIESAGDASAPYEMRSMTMTHVQLQAAEVQQLLERGAAATASENAIIAVVDRFGRVLGVRVEQGVLDQITDTDTLVFAIDGAIAKARTAALFANGDPVNGTLAPLTSRTVRFISQSTITEREVDSNPNVDGASLATALASTERGPGFVAPIGLGGHFPPDIRSTPLVDLFGIEHTNRDSNLHPGPDGVRGTADDIQLRTELVSPFMDADLDPIVAGRFNIDPSFVPDGNELYAPESYGHAENSGLLPDAQSRGIATLPGGIPLFRDTTDDGFGDTIIGGIGVFFPGPEGYASFEQGFVPDSGQTTFERNNAPLVLESEYIAFAAAGGSLGAEQVFGISGAKIDDINGVAPVECLDLPFGRLDLVGVQLEVFGPIAGQLGVEQLLDFGTQLGVGDPNSGADQPLVNAVGNMYRDGLEVPFGYLVTPHASSLAGGPTAAEVQQIIEQGIAAAEEIRAAVRLPLGSRTRMVFAVTDTNGEVLGLYRMRDATTFSIDVAVAKARNVAYYADENALQPIDDVLETDAAGNVLPPGTAYTNRTFRFLAQPRFPSGIDDTEPPPFSILNNGNIDRQTGENIGAPAPVAAFDSVLGYDAFFPMTNFRDPGDAGVVAAGGPAPVANQNGIVFFPGSTPIYRGDGTLIGGFGVSGDGVDQDDVVTCLGAMGFRPEDHGVIRADQTFLRGVRLPYFKSLRNPVG